jgi:hypothetical protein
MRPITLAVVLLTFSACGPGSDRGDDGSGGDGGSGSGSGNQDGCSDAAKLVYVVDSNNTFSKFDPATKTFSDIGQLACPTSGGQPFSMGVDRNATAWVLYDTGELFKVDTSNLNCTKTTWASQQGLLQFGMGFSTNMAGGSEDTLFVAGGTDQLTSSTKLAKLDTSAFTATPVGTISGWPELTGTGNAELWGWFPSDALGTTTPRVEQIDKTTGAAVSGKTYNLSSLMGAPRAWAFAFWGGDFWIFLKRQTEQSTIVYQIDSANGTMKGMTAPTGREIVGAGVSTCAPVVIL